VSQLEYSVAVVRRGVVVNDVGAGVPSAGDVRDPIPSRSLSAAASASAQRFGISNQPVTAELRRRGESFVMFCVRYPALQLAEAGECVAVILKCRGRRVQ